MDYHPEHFAALRFAVHHLLKTEDNLQLIGPLSFLRPPNIEQPTYHEDGYLRSFILRVAILAGSRSILHRIGFTSQRSSLFEVTAGADRQYHIFSAMMTARDVHTVGRQELARALALQHFHEALTTQWYTPLFRF